MESNELNVNVNEPVAVIEAPAAAAADAVKKVSIAPQKFEVEINISPSDEYKEYAEARMRRPDFAEDLAFANASANEYREFSKTEEELVLSDAPAIELFDKIALEVKGYGFDGEPDEAFENWREVTPELLALIPGNHKANFVRGMRIGFAKYAGTRRKGFVLGAKGTIPVEYTVGFAAAPVAVVRFEVPDPQETERVTFENEASHYTQGVEKGKKFNRTITDLQKCTEFFQLLMNRPGAKISDNGTVNGQSFSQCSDEKSRRVFLAQIDPIIQMRVVSAALVKYSARLRD